MSDATIEQSNNPLVRLNLPAIVAFFFAILSSWLPKSSDIQTPQTEKRPPNRVASEDDHLPTSSGLVSLSTDIWDDPFRLRSAAKARLQESRISNDDKSKANDSGTTNSEYYTRILQSYFQSGESKKKILVLPIIVNGESTEEETKDRVNYRHAVEYALATGRYSMEFPNRMTYCLVESVKTIKGKSKISVDGGSCIPIKLYSKKPAGSNKKQAVLVLWIDRGLLGDMPLDVIQQAVGEILGFSDPTLKRKGGETGDNLSPKATISVIGPAYSEGLYKILEEVKEQSEKKEVVRSWLGNINLYSPAATAGETQDADWPTNLAGRTDGSFSFKSTIGCDQQLVESILEELKVRQLFGGNTVIFSEASSQSPESLAAKIKDEIYEITKSSSAQPPEIVPYLQGFGMPRGGKVDDYLLRKLDSFAFASKGANFRPGNVSVVGVVGNQIQDKLAIIQASRQLFPNATLFTTDMHHEYLLKENLPYTRGLLVTSHYGLNSDPPEWAQLNNQSKSPIIFRDVYQASVFYASTLAISEFESELEGTSHAKIEERNPDLFEIGYTGAVSLASESKKTGDLKIYSTLLHSVLYFIATAVFALAMFFVLRPFFALLARLKPDVNNTEVGATRFSQFKKEAQKLFDQIAKPTRVFFPEISIACAIVLVVNYSTQLNNSNKWLLLIVAFFILILAMLFVLEPCFRRKWAQRKYLPNGLSWLRRVLTIFLVATVVISCMDSSQNVFEPFSVLSGISIWPSLAILIAMIVAAFVWILRFGENGLPWRLVPEKIEKVFPFKKSPFSDWPEELRGVPVGFNVIAHLGVNDSFKNVSVADDGHPVGSNPVPESILIFSRFVVFTILACFVIAEIDWPNLKSGVNWAFMPSPPARGAFAISMGTFIHTLAILMVLHVSAIALGQVLALRRFVELMRKHMEGVNESTPENIQKLYNACRWLQGATHMSSADGLWIASAIVLLFSIGRLPFWDSWHFNSGTIILMVIVPLLLSLPFALHLRHEVVSLRSMILDKLGTWKIRRLSETLLLSQSETLGNDEDEAETQNESDGEDVEAKAKYEEGLVKLIDNTSASIGKLKRGAFGGIWQDPLLGSIFLIFTTLLSGPGKDVFQYFLKLLR
jgi:hypothetical protein